MTRRKKWILIISSVLFFAILISLLFAAREDMRKTDKQVQAYFSNTQVSNLNINRFNYQEHELRYISSGLAPSDSTTAILFIHGAPGSSDAFYSYLADATLQHKAHLIAIDRLGYGFSSYGIPITDIQQQAAPLQHLMKTTAAKNWIIVSHSYGCPIAGVLAVSTDQDIKTNLMLCPVIDPSEEIIFFFSPWPSNSVMKHLFSKSFQVTSYEKMSHAEELRRVEPLWSQTKVPTIVMHGEKDWIAPVKNARYLEQFVDKEYLDIRIHPDISHFIPWQQSSMVVKEIENILD